MSDETKIVAQVPLTDEQARMLDEPGALEWVERDIECQLAKAYQRLLDRELARLRDGCP